MAEVKSPLIWDALYVLPPGSLQLLQYLAKLSEFGGDLPGVGQETMGEGLGISRQAAGQRLQPLLNANLVLATGGGRAWTYRLHPTVAKYPSEQAMTDALKTAVQEMKDGTLVQIDVPVYEKLPPQKPTPLHAVA